jgi:hypothetical protein
MIYESLGEKTKAKESLSRALALNPYFHPLFARTAAEALHQVELDIDRAAMNPERQGG